MACITLLSDFGLQDASVASVKGILMQYIPDLPVIDISHLSEPFNLQQAAYLFVSAYRNFPPGTCHVLLIDIFSEKTPRLLLAEKDGHYFLSPDNGLLSIAFGGGIEHVWTCFELKAPGVFKDWINRVGEIIKDLQHTKPTELKLNSYELKKLTTNFQPIINAGYVECQVIHIDHYENVIINITRQQCDELRGNRSLRIQFMRDEVRNCAGSTPTGIWK
jgi:S-adenosylmethionine hydrolase